ncbi:MAG: tetratricopeptide repeat protein [Promethearchaeota archaeon]
MAFQFTDVEEENEDEGSPDGLLHRARGYMATGKPQKALDLLQRALQRVRDQGFGRLEYHILNALSEVYLELRKYKAALKSHKQIIKIIKADMEAWIEGAPTPEEKQRRKAIADDKPIRTTTQTPRSRSRSRRKTKTCKHCGSPIEPGDKYCIGCGREVTRSK